jgi:hypothetical protein
MLVLYHLFKLKLYNFKKITTNSQEKKMPSRNKEEREKMKIFLVKPPVIIAFNSSSFF